MEVDDLPPPSDEADDDYVPVVVRTRERLLGTSSYLLIAALLVIGGFVGGAKWKSSSSSTPTASAATTGAAGAANAARTGGNGFGARNGANGTGGFGGENATFGQVKLVDGTNVYVEDAQGNVVKVSTGPNTTIEVSKPGTVADLKAGDNVVVQGSAGSDGTVAATSITSGLGAGGRRTGTGVAPTTAASTAPSGG